MSDPNQALDDLRAQLATARLAFQRDVVRAAMNAIGMAVQTAPAIGEVSVAEAKRAVLTAFRERLGLP